MSEYQQYQRGGRFFGDMKGVRISKRAGTEVWAGQGSLGGLMVDIEVLAHIDGREIVITCEMFGLVHKDVLTKVGALWSGKFCYIKAGSDGSKWVNLKSAKALGAQDDSEGEW